MPIQPVPPPDPGGDRISLSGLSRAEAREFNKFFMLSFAVFTIIAIVAHILVWSWRPWLQGTPPAISMIDHVRPLLTLIG